MNLGSILAGLFEKIPEWSIKNDMRYFLAFNKIIPKFISDLSPVKGYELYYKLKKGDIVVDAGAYPGDYAVFASRKIGRTGKIICFEPDKKNRKILYKNLKKEGLENFIIVPKGLWDENKTLSFKGEDGLHSTLSEDSYGKIEVVKLDDELRKLGISKVNVIKMDIEGAEIQAIKGAVETLKKNKVNVMIASYHVVNGRTTSFFLEEFLKNLGYKSKSDFKKHLTTYAWKD